MKPTRDRSIRDFVTWFCTSAPEQIAFGASAALLIAGLGYLALQALANYRDQADSTAGYLLQTIVGASAICVVLSLSWAIRKYRRDATASETGRVLVVEAKGLGGIPVVPLAAVVPTTIAGQREQYLLDVRLQGGGVEVPPEKLAEAVVEMRSWVDAEIKRHDRGNVTLVYGGLTAVPLTFLTGVVLDDEGRIIVMDWDRAEESWRTLDENDDGLRFEVSGIDGLAPGTKEVIVAIAVSYPILEEDLRSTFDLPVVRMTLPDLESSHWSKRKQMGLAQQLVGTAKALGGRGVDRIHLVLAAQNSVVFTFGRRYDTRNLPDIVVYQFEGEQTARYPWGLQMPVAGAGLKIVRNTRSKFK